jgi:hypothetical protein
MQKNSISPEFMGVIKNVAKPYETLQRRRVIDKEAKRLGMTKTDKEDYGIAGLCVFFILTFLWIIYQMKETLSMSKI